MPEDQLPTRGVAATDTIEEQSKDLLRSKLPHAERIFNFFDGKHPNIDGLVEFMGSSGSTGVKMFFSLKGTTSDITYHDCETQFLNYCYQAKEPCFLILVNVPRNEVYWIHIDPAYIANELGIPDLAAFTQQSKRIHFLETQTIDNNAGELIEVCRKHYADNAPRFTGQPAAAAVTPERAEEAPVVPEATETRPFADVQSKFTSAAAGMDEKMILYHAFVYTFRPFYLDQRSDARRRALLPYLGITDSEERYIIEALTTQGLLERTGELLSVTDKNDALSSFDHYLNSGRIDLDEVTRISAL